MGPGISLIGMGASGLDSLSGAARAALDAADLLVGSARLLALVPEDGRARRAWPSPWSAMHEALVQESQAQRVAVLVTGDPSWFSAGKALYALHEASGGTLDLQVYPAPSAFSLAASRLGWSLEAVQCLSAHGRDAARALNHLDGRRALLLTDAKGLPDLLQAHLRPRAWLLADLASEQERVSVLSPGLEPFGDLVVLALEAAERGPRLPVDTLGFEEWAQTDGMQTKAELRALAAAALDVRAGETLWDVGAGVGGIASLYGGRAQVFAIERDTVRAAMLRANAPFAQVLEGEASALLPDLPTPNAIFFGGGLSLALLDAAWERLGEGGRLVAHAVTVEGEAALLNFAQRHAAPLKRIALETLQPLGAFQGWQPARAVVQLRAVKP